MAASPQPGGRRSVGRRSLLVTAGLGVAVAGAAAYGLTPRPPKPLTVDAMLQQRPFLVAHRGSELDWPEMSMYGFERCVARGIQALEMSVSRTSDGVWFGLHDGTLDRTSGTSGYVAREHTWKEVRQHRISAAATTDPRQPDRPYLDLVSFLDRFAAANVLFIDPKAVDPHHYPELLEILRRHVRSVRTTIVAKSEASNTAWPEVAKASGIRSWGFYYGKDLPPASRLFTDTIEAWDLVGLDQDATADQWGLVTSVGKPVIGHVISTRAGRDRVVRLGATGVMCSDVVAVQT